MKIVTIIGARPQFIKAAPVSKELRKVSDEVLIHTGQHYDFNMSEIFFRELHLPPPDYNLGIGSGTHGWQTGQMISKIEPILLSHNPNYVLVYGDTNSTLAGALSAAKQNIKVIHVEAGLRSFNRSMPEELNRVLTDHVSDVLFCPSETAVNNLSSEGIRNNVFFVGDVMSDSLRLASQFSTDILDRLRLNTKNYILATVHRAENTDKAENLEKLICAFNDVSESVVVPLHPRTQKKISKIAIKPGANIKLIQPLGYLDMVTLERNARIILTDSGGIQKEAYWLEVPCVTLRSETEWVETVEEGWNVLSGCDGFKILDAVKNFKIPGSRKTLYGDGYVSHTISQRVLAICSSQ